MLIKFNPSIAGYTNASIGTNKNMQSRPAFGMTITPNDVINIANTVGISGSRVQRLGDMAGWINRRGLPHFLNSHMYKGQMEDFKIKPALEELVKIAQSGK